MGTPNQIFKLISGLYISVFILAGNIIAQDLPRPSPKASVSQTIGLTDVEITYCRPGVKERKIWDGLVPYNKMWRTGANESTTISFSDAVKVNGHPVPAGTYSLFTIPAESEWTIILNKNSELNGTSGYKEEEDLLRFQVQPQPADFKERMSFSFTGLEDNSAKVVLHWEKLKVPFTVEVNVHEKAMANIREAMANLKEDDWLTPYRCASYYLHTDTNLEEALNWINTSTSRNATYFNMETKARILGKLGKTKEAIAAAEKSVELAKASDNNPNTADLEKMIAEWKGAM